MIYVWIVEVFNGILCLFFVCCYDLESDVEDLHPVSNVFSVNFIKYKFTQSLTMLSQKISIQ